MKYYNASNHAKNLPDCYKQDVDSNNYKILEIERSAVESLREELRAIEDILSLDNATGSTLDLYGERLGQPRGIATDAQYRLLLKAKIARSLTTGTHDSLIRAIAQTFNCKPSDVVLRESNDPCVVEDFSVPLKIINSTGLSPSQTHQIIQSLLPAGVTLNSYLIEGTFCFGNGEKEYDASAGFALNENAGDGDDGGYFGAAGLSTGNDTLPIY